MTKQKAIQIIEAYDALIEAALYVVSTGPFYASVDDGDRPRIAIDGDDVVLSWREYESDYYGGGYTTDADTRFPADVLFMGREDLDAWRAKIKREEQEKAERLRAAQQAVAKDRAEAHDRAEWARLRNKYGS